MISIIFSVNITSDEWQ